MEESAGVVVVGSSPCAAVAIEEEDDDGNNRGAVVGDSFYDLSSFTDDEVSPPSHRICHPFFRSHWPRNEYTPAAMRKNCDHRLFTSTSRVGCRLSSCAHENSQQRTPHTTSPLAPPPLLLSPPLLHMHHHHHHDVWIII